jgi:hypothetical protein
MLRILVTDHGLSPADYLCWAEAWPPLMGLRFPLHPDLGPPTRSAWVERVTQYGTCKQVTALWRARQWSWDAAAQWRGFLARHEVHMHIMARELHVPYPVPREAVPRLLQTLAPATSWAMLLRLVAIGALLAQDTLDTFAGIRALNLIVSRHRNAGGHRVWPDALRTWNMGYMPRRLFQAAQTRQRLTRLSQRAYLDCAWRARDADAIRCMTDEFFCPFYLERDASDAAVLAATRLYLDTQPPRTSDLMTDNTGSDY